MALHHLARPADSSEGSAGAANSAERAGKLRLFVSRHRRVGAAILTAAAVASGLTALRPPEVERVEVRAAAADLPGGTRLSSSDLTTLALRPNAVPAGAVRARTDVSARILAGPMREGEPLTDARLVGTPLLAQSGRVAAPVRVADAGIGRLLDAGDRVDVLTAATQGSGVAQPARRVATSLRVLAVPRRGDDRLAGTSAAGGALILLATTPEQAAALASAAVTSRITVTLRGPA